jgi:hypothetical protein
MREDSSEAFSPVLGDLGCHSVANEQISPLAALVERTVADTIPILRFSMDASASELALACPAPPGVGVTAPATPCLSDGFWSDANLGGVLDLGLSRAVGNAGWRCDDCETAQPFREQIATSEALMPFVSAYVWPVESDGGKSVEILICSGANGASTTDGNPILLRLGFLVAQGFVESAVMRPELARLADLGRNGTAKLHEIEVELARLLASTSAKEIACEVSDRFSWYTRVRLSDCRRVDGA